MDPKSKEFLLIISFLVFVPARYALWCPEGCYCDNENLFVNCGNEDAQNLHAKLLTGESEEEFKFTSIPITLNPHIKQLFVRNTSLARLDSTLQNYPYLEELHLGWNKIQYLSPGSPFYSQNYLRYLSLRNNRIKHLDTPDCFEGLHSLKTLDLSGNELAILRAEIDVFREVPNLEKLDLSNNQISWVAPDVFSPLQSLINLDLCNNKLLVIPFTVPFGTEPIKLLPAISSLNMAYNPLKSEYVEKIEKDGNEESVLKSNHNKNQNARRKSQNKEEDYSKTKIKENGPMSRIKKMDISGIDTERTNICMILSQLPNLKDLVFINAVADSLACIETLSQLESLKIGFDDSLNQLEPTNFYAMPNLKTLMVQNASNLISIRNDAFLSNAYLETIAIESNPNLKEISLNVFSRLPYLKHLSLKNNSIEDILLNNDPKDTKKTSTVEDRNANHFPQLLDLDISYNRLDCNCTIEQIIASHSNIAQSLLENANIFCKNKEIMYKEETSSSSYYINFVGPSGRYDKELETQQSRCNNTHSEEIVETILTILLIGFILLILVSFPVVGGGVAYFYFYKRRFVKKRNDTLRYDFVSEPQQISMTDATTLSYFPHRSSSSYLDTSKHSNHQGISESTSTLTLLHSKSIGSDIPTATGSRKPTTFSSASNLQQKLFANKIITSDYPSSTMAPSFAWNDMSKMDFDDQEQKQEYLDRNDPHFLAFPRHQNLLEKNEQSTKVRNKEFKNSNLEHLRSKYHTNEHHMHPNTFHVEDFDINREDVTYANQRFQKTQNLNIDPMVYPSNQVDLIDIIGASQRYRTNEL